MKTRFILIQTSHAGNVGAAARALKVMSFDDLVLVQPRWPNVLRREETIQRASGANNVLEQCRVVASLDEALDGMDHICATAMTPRDFGPPTQSPRLHFEQLLARPTTREDADGSANNGGLVQPSGVAFLFGSERFGMRNEDVYKANVCLSIPTNPSFGSLNLAAAVQLVAYDWRMALDHWMIDSPAPQNRELADSQSVQAMLNHLQQALVAIEFLDPQAPKKLMPRLNQLMSRAQPSVEEIHILRGMAKAMLQVAEQARR